MSCELLASIDALDAVVSGALERPRLGRGFIEFTRREAGRGRIAYHLTSHELGDIGDVELRLINQAATWLEFSHVSDPGTREMTPDELAILRGEDNRGELLRLIADINKTRAAERRDLLEKRRHHFSLVAEMLQAAVYNELGHVLIPAHLVAQDTAVPSPEQQQGGTAQNSDLMARPRWRKTPDGRLVRVGVYDQATKSVWLPQDTAVPSPSPSPDGQGDSGHYHYSSEGRRGIAQAYRAARDSNDPPRNKNTWANCNYQISAKTLNRYLKEFPENGA